MIDNMRLGGTELNAVRTAERLDHARFDLRVVCLSEGGPLTERYDNMGVAVTRLPLRSFYGLTMFSSGWRFVRLLRRERADIVHAHDVYSNIFATLWGCAARVPVIIASRRWWHSLPNRKLQAGNRVAFSLATGVLANSSQVAGTVKAEGVSEEKIWTIPNFADDDAFLPVADEERARIRRSWNAGENDVVIGCVARFDPVKDHATLLRAFAIVLARHPEAFLVLIGDGETRPVIESLLTELHLRGRVHLAGELRGGRNHHHGLDISVLTSTSEGFPNSLVEAMAAGNPVVATRVGGNGDAVVDGETGYLVTAGDPAELSDALSRLIVNREVRQRFGRAGQERARREFDATSVVGRLEAMYDLLVQRGSGPAVTTRGTVS